MDRGGWWATVHGVAKELDITTKQQQKVYKETDKFVDMPIPTNDSQPTNEYLQL